MASVHQQKGRPNWFCRYTDSNGIRRNRSTGKTDQTEAMEVCQQWEGSEPAAKRHRREKIKVGRAEITSVGVNFPKDFTREEWEAFGKEMDYLIWGQWFSAGDLLLAIENRMTGLKAHDPEKIKLRRLSRKTLATVSKANENRGGDEKLVTEADLKAVAKMFPAEVRIRELSWKHHRAALSSVDQERAIALLKSAKDNNWTAGELYHVARSRNDLA